MASPGPHIWLTREARGKRAWMYLGTRSLLTDTHYR